MWRLIREQGGNWCCRIGLGFVLCVVLILLAAKTDPTPTMGLDYHLPALAAADIPSQNLQITQKTHLDELEHLAREEPVKLLKLALKNYQESVRDYVCTFTKQERVNGHLKDVERMRVCCKEAPFSVLMTWLGPKRSIDKVLFVAKDGNTTMLARPSGFAGLLVSTVRRDVNDPRNKNVSRRGPDQFGFGRSLQRIIGVCEQAQKNGDLVFEYLGIQKVEDRPCLLLLRTLPMAKGYPSAELKLFIDQEYLLLTRIETYDTAGNLLALYMFTDIRFNLGLTDDLFTAKANGL